MQWTSGEATATCNLPLVPKEATHEEFLLFAEDEDTSLAGKACFFHLAVFIDE
jgi:hypothetical protein